MSLNQYTFAMIKSDSIERMDSIAIMSSVSAIGATIYHRQYMTLGTTEIDALYGEHKGKHFYDALVWSVSRGVVAMVLYGPNTILRWRDLMGATDPKKAQPGTLRHDFGVEGADNAVHGSATPEDAKREIKLIFPLLSPWCTSMVSYE